MSGSPLSEQVQALLREHLRSFEQLEILLLLRVRQDEAWTPDAIATELNLDADLVREAIPGLQASALLQRTSAKPARYQYGATDAALGAAVDELMKVYPEQRTTIVSQMSANAIERIRSGSLIAWADAFVIRRRKDDG